MEQLTVLLFATVAVVQATPWASVIMMYQHILNFDSVAIRDMLHPKSKFTSTNLPRNTSTVLQFITTNARRRTALTAITAFGAADGFAVRHCRGCTGNAVGSAVRDIILFAGVSILMIRRRTTSFGRFTYKCTRSFNAFACSVCDSWTYVFVGTTMIDAITFAFIVIHVFSGLTYALTGCCIASAVTWTFIIMTSAMIRVV